MRSSRTPYFIKQTDYITTLNWPVGSTPGSNPGYGYSFQVNTLPQWSAFATLYDEYKLCAVKFRYISAINTAGPDNPTYMIHTAIDYDDAGAPTSADQIRNYQTYKVFRGTQSWSRYWKPRFTGAAITTVAGTTLASSSRRGWLNSDSNGASVSHYGIKLFVDYIEPLVNAQSAQIEVTQYVSFRNVQ
jgi:hypothetical protein